MTEKLALAIERALRLNEEAQEAIGEQANSDEESTNPSENTQEGNKRPCDSAELPAVVASTQSQRGTSPNTHDSSQCEWPVKSNIRSHSQYFEPQQSEESSSLESDSSLEPCDGMTLHSKHCNVAGDIVPNAKVDSCASTESSIEESSIDHDQWNAENTLQKSFVRRIGEAKKTPSKEEDPKSHENESSSIIDVTQLEYDNSHSESSSKKDVSFNRNSNSGVCQPSNMPCTTNKESMRHSVNLSDDSVKDVRGHNSNARSPGDIFQEVKMQMARKPRSIRAVRENLIRMSEEVKHAAKLSKFVFSHLKNTFHEISNKIEEIAHDLDENVSETTGSVIDAVEELLEKANLPPKQVEHSPCDEVEQLRQLKEHIK